MSQTISHPYRGGENVEHWQQVPGHLSDNFINRSPTPAGSNASNQITSIPSPFARMDLVRTASGISTATANRKAPLSITAWYLIARRGEIFFNIEAFSDKVECLNGTRA